MTLVLIARQRLTAAMTVLQANMSVKEIICEKEESQNKPRMANELGMLYANNPFRTSVSILNGEEPTTSPL